MLYYDDFIKNNYYSQKGDFMEFERVPNIDIFESIKDFKTMCSSQEEVRNLLRPKNSEIDINSVTFDRCPNIKLD